MIKTIKMIAICAVFSITVACENDDEKEVPQTGNVFISTMVPSPDGMSGSAYMQLITNMDVASYDNKNSTPITYSIPPVIDGNNIFDMPGGSNTTNTIVKYTIEDNSLVLKRSLIVPENSMPTDIAVKGDKAYIALRGIGQILVVDHNTMTELKTIDIKKYSVDGDNNPDPTCLIIRDNHLFVSLSQVKGYLPDPKRPAIDILIIDLNTDKPIKMITNTSSGMTYPTSATDQNSLFMDENKDIYISCYGSMGMNKSGFLRIKNGETEFDKDYQFILSDAAIDGDANKLNYLSSVVYYGDNKAYGIANIPAYFSDPYSPDYFNDRFNLPIEINLRAKTIKSLDMPRSNGYGAVVELYNQSVVFGLSTESDNGFYIYDPTTETASDKAVVTISGYPYKFYQFK